MASACEIGFVIDTEGATAVEVPEYTKYSPEEEKDALESKLEEILFGKQPAGRRHTGPLDSSSEKEESENEEEESERLSLKLPDVPALKTRKAAAWTDKDDEDLSVDITAQPRRRKLKQTTDEAVISGATYSKRLRFQYEKLVGHPEWADRTSQAKRHRRRRRGGSESESSSGEEEEEEEDGGFLQRTGDLLKLRSDQLPKGTLDLKQMNDINVSKRAEAVVQALEFHPTSNVALVAGFNKTLDLFQVDGQKNPKLQSVHLKDFPISTAHFSQDGTEVVMAGRKKRFYVYDMIAGKVRPVYGIRGHEKYYFDKFVVSPDNQYLVFLGKDGYLVLVSNKTKQWMADLKMNGDVLAVTFTADSHFMFSLGSEGKLYVWDMSTRLCVHTFVDEGCIVGTGVAVSPDNRYLACGSQSGIVNLYAGSTCIPAPYREQSALSACPKPLKALMNLTTGVDSLCINPTSELMMMASRKKKNALKVMHLPSQTVFSNWPSTKANLGFVSSVAFSPHSKYMAIGSANGRALLFRLNYYSQHSSLS